MNIKICLHDTLKSRVESEMKVNDGKVVLVLPPGSLVQDLLKVLNLSEDYIGLMLVNGKQVGYKKQLSNGDKIDFFSPMAGG